MYSNTFLDRINSYHSRALFFDNGLSNWETNMYIRHSWLTPMFLLCILTAMLMPILLPCIPTAMFLLRILTCTYIPAPYTYACVPAHILTFMFLLLILMPMLTAMFLSVYLWLCSCPVCLRLCSSTESLRICSCTVYLHLCKLTVAFLHRILTRVSNTLYIQFIIFYSIST